MYNKLLPILTRLPQALQQPQKDLSLLRSHPDSEKHTYPTKKIARIGDKSTNSTVLQATENNMDDSLRILLHDLIASLKQRQQKASENRQALRRIEEQREGLIRLTSLTYAENAEIKNLSDTYKDNLQNTFLHLAIIYNRADIAETLINSGVNLDVKNIDGDSALHLAAYHNNEKVIKLLIDSGADLNQQNNKGETPLHIAAQHRNWGIIEALVKAKADLNKQNNVGETALHLATLENNLEIVELLLKAKANPTIGTPSIIDMLALNITEQQITGHTAENHKKILGLALKMSHQNNNQKNIDSRITFSIAKTMIGLFYSSDNFPIPNKFSITNLILEEAKKSDCDQKFVKILQDIAAQKFLATDQITAKIIASSIENHASFFVIHGNDLYYIDGNCPFDDGSEAVNKKETDSWGVVKFKIKKGQNEESTIQNLKNITNIDEMDIHLKDVVEFTGNTPKIYDQLIPTKKQKRGNCVGKSQKLLMRLVDNLTAVDGHDITAEQERRQEHKKFFQELVGNNLDYMQEAAKISGPFQKEAAIICKNAEENRERKINAQKPSGAASRAITSNFASQAITGESR